MHPFICLRLWLWMSESLFPEFLLWAGLLCTFIQKSPGIPMPESPGPCAGMQGGRWLLCRRPLCSSYCLMATLACLPSFSSLSFLWSPAPHPPPGLLNCYASPLHVPCPRRFLSVVLKGVWHLVSAPADTILSVLSPRLSRTPSGLQ